MKNKISTESLQPDLEQLEAIYKPAAHEKPSRDFLSEAIRKNRKSTRLKIYPPLLALAASVVIFLGFIFRAEPEVQKTVQTEVPSSSETITETQWNDFGTGKDSSWRKMVNIRKRINSLKKDNEPVPDRTETKTETKRRYA